MRGQTTSHGQSYSIFNNHLRYNLHPTLGVEDLTASTSLQNHLELQFLPGYSFTSKLRDEFPASRAMHRTSLGRLSCYNRWNFYRAGFTIAYAIRSVDSIRSLDSRLRRVVWYYTPAAPQGLYKMNFQTSSKEV